MVTSIESHTADELHQPILQPNPPPPSEPPSAAAAYQPTSELEKVLSSTHLPLFKRLRLASWIELRLLFRLAGPAVMVYLINNSMSVSTRIFSGHLGNLELAAASLGNQGIQLFAYGLMVLSWVVVYKIGAGLIGASLVLSLSWWIIVGAQFIYILVSHKCKATWTGFRMEAFSGLWEFVKLSSASAVMLCLETWYMQILVLVAGLLPDPELALDALSVCLAINGLLFMVSVGFNAAASVRVGNELGAGNPKSAAFSVLVVNLVSFVIAVIEAMVVLSLRNVISYAFTSGETVADAVSELCPFLAVTLILNGVQPVLSGVAVGCGWQAFVAYVNVGCYYFVGLPIGCVLGFKFGLGAKGIWSGMIGGTVMQTSILIWTTYRTDWNKEVEKAKNRLKKWDVINEPLLKDSADADQEADLNGASQ
ncbi:hypothetical protein RHSIM_Rhsim02G0108100 [Rhododendron simsii]|uniref:Protein DETOXIFICATION n=1 Tax=Rhododendron simsii TaxID=118357 RepID=A0A834H8J4_RHOSS|nr:hypothetical protein RHSIM_Rhsim02G0108100 [Rhododendron simsii]